jgi:hypothetical protein
MTKRNLVGVLLATIMLVASCGTVTQADAKSVPSKAAQSVTEPSNKVVQVRVVQAASRVSVRPSVNPAVPTKMRGIYASAYIGKHYKPRWESVRKCIVRRESGGNYRAANKHSTARGAYQFLAFWQRKLPVLMHKPHLRNKPIVKWSRYDQDHAFWFVFKNGKGKRNWYYAPKQCW